jgi:hypothetical protein
LVTSTRLHGAKTKKTAIFLFEHVGENSLTRDFDLKMKPKGSLLCVQQPAIELSPIYPVYSNKTAVGLTLMGM